MQSKKFSCREIYECAAQMYVVLTGLLFCFEHYFGGINKIVMAAAGLCGAVLILFAFFYMRLFRQPESWLMPAFLCWIVISVMYNCGFAVPNFFKISTCMWIYLVSVYFVLKTAKDPRKIVDAYAKASVAGLAVVNLLVLVKATSSLFYEAAELDLQYGCFRNGRLCAFSNSNVVTFCAAALIMLSVYCIVLSRETKGGGVYRNATGNGIRGRRTGLLYFFAAFIGWINLSLTGTRTSIIGVAFFAGLLVFKLVFQLSVERGTLFRHLFSFLCALTFVALIIHLTIHVPMFLYKGLLSLFATVFDNETLAANISLLEIRDFTYEISTFSDRTVIWDVTLKQVFSTPRRTWFGISYVSREAISGIYPFHHEILQPHAHSAYLELLRRCGLPGFSIMTLWLAGRVSRGLTVYTRNDGNTDKPSVCLAAIAGASLIMAIVEPVVLPYYSLNFLAVPVFMICGYCDTKCGKGAQR